MAKPVTIVGLLKARAKKKASAYHKNHPKPTTSNKPKKPKRVIKLKKFNYV